MARSRWQAARRQAERQLAQARHEASGRFAAVVQNALCEPDQERYDRLLQEAENGFVFDLALAYREWVERVNQCAGIPGDHR